MFLLSVSVLLYSRVFVVVLTVLYYDMASLIDIYHFYSKFIFVLYQETASLPKHVVEIPALPSVAELAVKVSSGRLWDLKLGLSGMRDDESSFWALGGDSFTALTLLEKVHKSFALFFLKFLIQFTDSIELQNMPCA